MFSREKTQLVMFCVETFFVIEEHLNYMKNFFHFSRTESSLEN